MPAAPSTSLRSRDLSHTLAAARALAARWGIAGPEEAGLTDHLGLAVTFVERGAGEARRIYSGKGLAPLEAEVGALMEAIEIEAAVRAGRRFDGGRALLQDIVAAFDPPLTVADLAPRLDVKHPGERVLAVDTCEDLATGARCTLPAELLHQQLPPGVADEPVFGFSSNGLASGNTLEEATLHALLEVLERDAVALDMAGPRAEPLELSSLPEPYAGWLPAWRERGVTLHLHRLPSVAGLPCLRAELRDAGTAPRGLGFGLHPSPAIALARAVSEAAQSRAYQLRYTPGSAAPAADHGARDAAAPIAFGDIEATPCGSIAEALADVLQRLRAQGLPWVLRRSMNLQPDAADLDGLHVVKVVVPGCESVTGGALRIGRRLARRLSGLD